MHYIKRIGSLCICFFYGIILLSAQQKKFVLKELPVDWRIEKKSINNEDEKNYFDITEILPKDHVKNGSIDYTQYLQKALSSYQKVKFPPFPILINDKGLTIRSDTELYFPEGSQLKLASSKEGKYEILRLHNVSNVNIYNPNILGDRETHIGSEGEWGMGISIRGSKNIKIYNPNIQKCWGDGIYSGHYKNKQVNKLEVYGGFINNNRRNGISITSGNHVIVDGTIISNTEGISPQSGVKIEPSNDKAELNEITIKNVKTFNNKNAGIGFGGIEKLIGKTNKALNISLINHIDKGSYNGLFIGRILSPDKLAGPSLKGKFNIINPKWENNENSSFVKRKHYGRGPTIYLSELSPKLSKELWRGFKFDKDIKFIESNGKSKTSSE